MENNIQNQEQPVDNKPKNNEDEIDLVEIIQKLWRNRRFILKVTTVFAIFGLLVAVSLPSYYTASCTLVPQTGANSSGGSLGGLAALAGINLGSTNSGAVLSPNLYPKIMSNVNFQKEFIYTKINISSANQPITLYEYFTNKKYQKFNLLESIKKYTIGLPRLLIGAIKNMYVTIKREPKAIQTKIKDIFYLESTSIQNLTASEKQVSNAIKANLSLSVNSKDGLIILSSKMDEPLAAAELVQKGVELLQKYITKFKIEKVMSNLEFIEKRYEEAKTNFETKQVELAKFRDSNKNISSAIAKTQEEKLTSEYTLLLGIYTELAKQKEQAKIAVTETTPILTVIEPVIVPIEKEKSKSLMMFVMYTFLGFVIGIGIVFVLSYLEIKLIPNIKNYWFIPKIV